MKNEKPGWIRPVSYVLGIVTFVVGFAVSTGGTPGLKGAPIAILAVPILAAVWEAVFGALRGERE